MNTRIIEPSELIVNQDGSIYHLHLRPEHIAENIILVGDPGRVEMVSSYFSKIEYKISKSLGWMLDLNNITSKGRNIIEEYRNL